MDTSARETGEVSVIHTLRHWPHWANSDPRNYRIVKIPKRDGSERTLYVPIPPLKTIQNSIAHDILYHAIIHPKSIAFKKGHSIAHLALLLSGTRYLVRMDLKDFFPSIEYRRVQRCLLALSVEAPSLIAGTVTMWQQNRRILPQGAPTSPIISNIVAYNLDRRLDELASSQGMVYMRYADDMIIAADSSVVFRQSLIQHITKIASDEGFTVNRAKTQTIPRGQGDTVTGIEL